MQNIFYAQDRGYEKLCDLLIKKRYSKIFILTDSNTNVSCSPILLGELATEIPIELLEIEAGEASKNIEICMELWNSLIELEADRKSLLIGLGGGVVTDITGFVASVFKRGIDFINIPTTLLGMVDASLGGKNGVDLGGLKNQIGTITQPQMILVDFNFLDTLPNEELRSGYAEMLKHGLIKDRIYWNNLSDFRNIDLADLGQHIIRSIEIKTLITEEDPTENGCRKALNYGHTLGHAIESYCLNNPEKPSLLHGEAISIGMILEAYLSFRVGLLSQEAYTEIKTVLKSIYPFVDFHKEDINQIISLLRFDKKNEYGNILFVLLDGVGNFKIDQIVDSLLIQEAFESYKN